MRLLIKLVLISAAFSFLNIFALVTWSSPATAKDLNETRTTRSGSPADNAANDRNAARGAVDPSTSSGIIYAPRDVVDLTRLVLETSRDQTTHVAHYIENATLVIIIFFSVLGACFTLFGIKKYHDFEMLTKGFEESVAISKKKVDELEEEYKQKIEASSTTLQVNLESAATKLHREINDQIELVSARVEIEQSRMAGKKPEEVTRTLHNASKRIQKVLAKGLISKLANIRGLADLAYALKRLGDTDGAYERIVQALEMARTESPDGVALLAYNAACYAAIENKRQDAISYLNEAITLDAHYRTLAKVDDDFTSLKDNEAFKELLA